MMRRNQLAKGCRFAELCHSEIGLEKRFLRHVLGQVRVLKYGICARASHILKAFDDSIESLRIALLCSPNARVEWFHGLPLVPIPPLFYST